MTTRDFMIGDWVHSSLHDVDTQITDLENDAFWLKDKLCWGRHFLREVGPIKLTEEMLKKNFPVPDNEPNYTVVWWPNDDGTFHVELQEDSEGDEIVLTRILYVHELQHMLRMVKCEKEIEL